MMLSYRPPAQPAMTRAAHQLLDVLLAGVEDVLQVGVQLLDGVGVGGVHGQGDHGPDGRQVHLDHAVVVGQAGRGQGLVVPRAAVDGQIPPGGLVCLPDGGQAGGLGGHGVDGVAGVLPQAGHAGADELHHLVLDIAALEQRAHQGDGHVVGAAAHRQRAGQIDRHHAGAGHIVGAAQQLLGQLAAALADGHGAQRAVAGVGVGAQDHLAAARELLPHILMDDGQVRRHEDAAILFGRRQAEPVVVLVDGAAHRAQAVVAVGQDVGQGELFQPRRPRRLDDAHEGDVVAGHRVKLDLEVVLVAAGVVVLQDAPCDGALFGPGHSRSVKTQGCQRLRRMAVRRDPLSARQIRAGARALDHFIRLSLKIFTFHTRPRPHPLRAGP